MKASDSERGEIVDDNLWTAGEPEKDVGGGIVAETDGKSEQFAQRYVYAGLGIFVLKRAERFGENQV